MNFLFSPPDIDIILSDVKERKIVEFKLDENGKKERLPLYYDGESVCGKVHFTLKNNKSFEHNGIKIEFIGQLQLFNDKSSTLEFVSLCKELARPGELTHSNSFNFEFREVEKPYESYYGVSVKLRYLLRVTINKLLGNITKETGLAVHIISYYPNTNTTSLSMSSAMSSATSQDQSLKTDVGIEQSLHIEFEYDKSRYHLKDVIVGKVYFLVNRLKVKTMEVELLRKETTGYLTSGMGSSTSNSSSNPYMERTECLLKYEVMDGNPCRGETVPIRIFLAGYDLQPTMRDVAKKFSVRFFLNLVLVDEDDRRYYKTREIQLWRKCDRFYRKLTMQNESIVESDITCSRIKGVANSCQSTTNSSSNGSAFASQKSNHNHGCSLINNCNNGGNGLSTGSSGNINTAAASNSTLASQRNPIPTGNTNDNVGNHQVPIESSGCNISNPDQPTAANDIICDGAGPNLPQETLKCQSKDADKDENGNCDMMTTQSWTKDDIKGDKKPNMCS